MERVCEDEHDIEALPTKQSCLQAKLRTIDISLIPTIPTVTFCNLYNTRFKEL